MSNDLKFKWDMNHLRNDFGEDTMSEIIWGESRPSQGYQQTSQQYYNPQYVQPQIQYIPVQQPQTQYVPQPQQAPIVLNNSGNNKSTANSIIKFIEFIIVLAFTFIFVCFLIQSPDTVDGLSAMINGAFDKLASSLEAITP